MKHAYHSRPAAPRLSTRLAAHPDNARPCTTPPERPQPSLSLIRADMAEWQRHQRQRDLVWQQLQRAEATALQS